MPDEDSEGHKLAMAFLANEVLDQQACYLNRGRQHAELPDAELDERWACALKTYARDPRHAKSVMLDDYAAEIGLRDRDAPLAMIEAEFDCMVAEIEGSQNDDRPDLEARLTAFLRDRDNAH